VLARNPGIGDKQVNANLAGFSFVIMAAGAFIPSDLEANIFLQFGDVCLKLP
jgi:hypothetical protein